MTAANTCPQCGAELPADAPSGICPKCLLAAGLASDTNIRDGRSDEAPTTPLPHSSRFVPPSSAELARHFPQLEILELIGAGGMGAVYKARQPGLDRVVAVKILPPEVGADPSFAQRFMREAQALARLGHQHIVSVYDFGEAGGLYYFIMEYVDGANLRQLIKSGELKPAEALAIVPQICEALQFAHDEGVVHRDIKPENILLDKRGRVKIADFGLARLLGAGAPEVSLTGTNQVLGTLHYMAPEQIQGLRTVDHRADIYSLGVVFYEMLTGELPLGRFAPPSQKVEVDVRLDEVVLRSLESEPQRRYQRVGDVKTDVESISQISPPTAIPTPQSNAVSNLSGLVTPSVDVNSSGAPWIKKLSNCLLEVAALGIVSVVLLLLYLLLYGAEPFFPASTLPENSSQRPSLLFYLTLTGIYALFAIPHAVIIATSAFFLQNRRGYWFCTFACILAMVPVSLAWPIGLPIGLWGLVVLASREVRSAFAGNVVSKSKVRSRPPDQSIQKVANALLVVGGLGLAATILLAIWLASDGVQKLFPPPDTRFGETRGSSILWTTIVLTGMYALVAVPHALIMIVAALLLRNGKAYWLAVAACALAALPITFAFPIGLPIGLWGLAVLTSQEVRAIFACVDSAEKKTPSERLFWPAIGLLIAAIIDGGQALILIGAAVSMLPTHDSNRAVEPLVYGVVTLTLGAIRLVGGMQILKLKSRALCTLASVTSLLPISCGSFIGIPAAIWALIELARADVKEAFAREKDRHQNTSDIATPSRAAVTVSAGTIRHWLAVPATLMQIAGLLLCPAAIALALLFIFDQFRDDPILVYGIVIASLVIGSLLIATGWKLKRLQDYGLCVATTLLLLPVSAFVPTFFLAGNSPGMFAPLYLLFPVAVWVLVLLLRTDVKAAFVSQAAGSNVSTSGMARTFHESSAPLVGQAEGVQDLESVSRPRPDAESDGEEDRQRAAELAERPPYWLDFGAMVLFALGWIFAGAMWNYRWTGLWVAIAVMATITYGVIRWKVAYVPALHAELLRQSRIRRGFALSAGLVLFILAMFLLVTAQTYAWDFFHSYIFRSFHFEEKEQTVQYAVRLAKLQGLGKDAIVSPGGWGGVGASITLPWLTSLFSGWLGFGFLFWSVSTVIDTRRFRGSWKNFWAPSLAISFACLVMLPGAQAIRTLTMGLTDSTVPPLEFRCVASSDQVADAINRWIEKMGYARAGGWYIEVVEQQKTVGKVYVVEVWQLSQFDRYRLNWRDGVWCPRPVLSIACVTMNSPTQAYVRVELPMQKVGSPEESLWPELLKGLETEILAAAKTQSP